MEIDYFILNVNQPFQQRPGTLPARPDRKPRSWRNLGKVQQLYSVKFLILTIYLSKFKTFRRQMLLIN